MDLNYFYHRRGRSLMAAAQATCEPSRAAHLGLARGYVAQIEAIRDENRDCARRLTLVAA